MSFKFQSSHLSSIIPLIANTISQRVNFKKMIPTSGVFKQSEVFKTLNSELVQAEEDKDKKWTTFMQKPSRPAPKTREERMRELNPPTERYQVRIVKQPKPKIAPDYKPPKSPVSFVRLVANIVSCSFCQFPAATKSRRTHGSLNASEKLFGRQVLTG